MRFFLCCRGLWVLLLACVVGLASAARAAERGVDVAALGAQPLSLIPMAALLEDPQGRLTFGELQAPAQAARFKTDLPATNALALGFTRSVYWLRLTLHNPGSQSLARMLVVDNPRISHIQAHLPDGQGGYRVVDTGGDTPFASRPYPNRGFVFPLALPAQAQQVVYLRVASTVGLLVPLQLWTPEAFHAHERNDYLVQAWYFGMATAMVLFNLMLWVALRDRIYLLYVVFVASAACSLAIKNGLAAEFVGQHAAWATNATYYSAISLTLVAMLLFMRRMLHTGRILPRADKLLLGLAGVYLLTLPVYAVALPAVAKAGIVLNAATAPVMAGVALACALKRQRNAYFFLGAFAMFLLGGLLTTLRAMGMVPTNALTVDGLQLGSALEMLLLAFALADRYNTLRRDKALAQDALLQAQQQLVDSLKTSEHELELRVAQRTDELQALNARLHALSQTDGLTGIANRRRFDEVLALEWKRAQRLGQPLAVLMLDVDWFKKYNDHHGHQVGDACLQQIARTLAATVCRSGDLVARYGGEEFVCVAPATDGPSALGMARKIVQAVRALALPHGMSPLGVVSVSVGVACGVPGPGTSAAGLLRRADAALYSAKAQGRNRAELAVDSHGIESDAG